MDFWDSFWATMWGALAGALVGAGLSGYLAARAATRQNEREKARFADQQNETRVLAGEQREETRRLMAESRAELYRDRMDNQFELIHSAASECVRLGVTPGTKPVAEIRRAWAEYLAAIERAMIHARDEDYAVLVGLRQFSAEPPRGDESTWGRLPIFMNIVGAWRRGELDYDSMITALFRNSHEGPAGGWKSAD